MDLKYQMEWSFYRHYINITLQDVISKATGKVLFKIKKKKRKEKKVKPNKMQLFFRWINNFIGKKEKKKKQKGRLVGQKEALNKAKKVRDGRKCLLN